jgi:hypothetical protein
MRATRMILQLALILSHAPGDVVQLHSECMPCTVLQLVAQSKLAAAAGVKGPLPSTTDDYKWQDFLGRQWAVLCVLLVPAV